MFIEASDRVVGSRGVVLLKLAAGSRARVCLQSDEPEVVQTHWFERQYLCPGWDCPACGTYATRVAVFQVAVVERGPEWVPCLLELTASEWSRTRMLAQMESIRLVAGTECELSRGSARSAIRCVAVRSMGEASAVLRTRERLIDVLSLLFKLPLREREESAKAWCERVRPAVATQLGAVIRRVG